MAEIGCRTSTRYSLYQSRFGDQETDTKIAWKRSFIQNYRTAFSTNSSIFRLKDLWRLCICGGARWQELELQRICPGCSVLYT